MSAKSGNLEAQNMLGYIYFYGKRVSKDYKKALFWYEKASLQEDSLAQFYVGQIYLLALGVKKDIEKAKIMFEKSCENGYEKSCLERDKLD